MDTLNNKIDFAVIFSVKRANPNGDPQDGNRPRTDFDGFGEVSDVCIKRKIRNRLMQENHSIFVQSDDNRADSYRSLKERAEGELKDVYKKLFEKTSPKKQKGKQEDENQEGKNRTDELFRSAACSKWFDVRAFGQVFAFGKAKARKAKAENEEESEAETDEVTEKGAGISIGIRGPVSIHPAFSVAKVRDCKESQQIVKSVNLEKPGPEKARDTMGMKHRVAHGLYVFYGAMNPQLASKTGFSDKDAEAIKEALKTLFRNDASSARPEGSMEVHKVYWWEHKTNNGQYSSAKVHRSVATKVRVKDGITDPKSIADYVIPERAEIEKELPGLSCEVLAGE
jgi:CRISPR-associated protein Csd2